MESTGVFWKSVYRSLERYGIKAYVVNAKHVKQLPGRKTDISDSKWLAKLGKYGLVKGSFIPCSELSNLRLITRYRLKVKSMIASEINRIRKVLNDSGIRLSMVFSDIQSISARAVIEGLIEGKEAGALVLLLRGRSKKKSEELKKMLMIELGEEHKFLLSQIIKHVKHLELQCEELEYKIFEVMKSYEEYWNMLQTIPGIDKLSAAMIIAETGVNMDQFGSSDKLSSWAGICPGNNESGGKRKSGRTVKGSSTLRRVLCESAHAAVRTRCQFQSFFRSFMVKKGYKKTIIAAAHKILRVIFSVLSNNQPYYDPAVDYEKLLVERNAPRWIKALTKYGFIN